MVMERKKYFLLLELISGLAMLSIPQAVMAQITNSSWLDRPPVNWNRPSLSDFPQLPKPVAAANLEQCRASIRQPASDADRALRQRGWHLFGPVQSFGITQILTATSGFDGMCRPMGYQAFVYVEGRYAGTLSPGLMDSRTDGALITARLISPTAINGEFARYSNADPLCCPSQTSFVSYRVRSDEIPDLVPTEIVTSPNCPNSQPDSPQSSNSPSSGSTLPSSNSPSLSGQRWSLIEINGQPVNTNQPYIEFDTQQQGRFSGSSGCNLISGGFASSDSTLTFDEIISTRRACIDPKGQQIEADFLRALESVTRFEIQAETLRLLVGDRPVLVFRR
uniref:DUF306 domain-containing protein n=1 Tax=Cyanothece sp. (strain PCC 7425 / ATCC 29141) TaxID=395961 RepID=B8HJR5_CYAP4